MKKLLLAILIAPLTLFATNGSYIIGISPMSKAMGGTGVGNYQSGSDALYKNSALLSELPGANGQIGLEVFGSLVKENVSASNDKLPAAGFPQGPTQDSTSKAEFLPTISGTYKLNDQMGLGLSAMVYGGDRVDMSGTTTAMGLSRTKADATVGRLALGFAYKPIKQLSIGISPFLKYGELALNTNGSTREPHGATGFGAQLGVAAFPLDGLSLGAAVQPKVRLKYKNIYDLASLSGAATGTLNDIDTQEPMQIGFGVAYSISSSWKVTADYRFIGWSSADTFKELGWQDQHVIAIGTEYKVNAWAVRAGFNYAKTPVREVSGENGATPVMFNGVNVVQQALSNLDVIGFPGFTQSHFCLGGGYDITPALALNASFVYAPKVTVTRAGTTGPNPYSYTGSASQWAATLGLGLKI